VTDPVTRTAAKIALLTALPLALLAGLLSFWRLGGFDNHSARSAGTAPGPAATSVVQMPVPSLKPADATMCLAFVAHLPAKLRDLSQRPVSAGGNQQNAAYGDPPITVACGGAPVSKPADQQSWVLSGVCWYADQSDPARTVWATLDRRVPIRVSVPAKYLPDGEGDLVSEFSAPIVAAVPSIAEPPAGCTP
jgi:hypothetical protein